MQLLRYYKLFRVFRVGAIGIAVWLFKYYERFGVPVLHWCPVVKVF